MKTMKSMQLHDYIQNRNASCIFVQGISGTLRFIILSCTRLNNRSIFSLGYVVEAYITNSSSLFLGNNDPFTLPKIVVFVFILPTILKPG